MLIDSGSLLLLLIPTSSTHHKHSNFKISQLHTTHNNYWNCYLLRQKVILNMIYMDDTRVDAQKLPVQNTCNIIIDLSGLSCASHFFVKLIIKLVADRTLFYVTWLHSNEMNLDNPATQIMKQAAKLKHKDWHPHWTPVSSDNLKRNKLHQSKYISKRKEVSSHSFHHTCCRNISNVTNHDKTQSLQNKQLLAMDISK